ncbi:hypothetical protein KSP40_PGU022638 [Platanthera guangdongensis]|uniref:Uncharacterized protein n=1 Tax=Platanthera guangdongensis TaxID=2320717 RepID=A0ABR2MDZ8_9ASPA
MAEEVGVAEVVEAARGDIPSESTCPIPRSASSPLSLSQLSITHLPLASYDDVARLLADEEFQKRHCPCCCRRRRQRWCPLGRRQRIILMFEAPDPSLLHFVRRSQPFAAPPPLSARFSRHPPSSQNSPLPADRRLVLTHTPPPFFLTQTPPTVLPHAARRHRVSSARRRRTASLLAELGQGAGARVFESWAVPELVQERAHMILRMEDDDKSDYESSVEGSYTCAARSIAFFSFWPEEFVCFISTAGSGKLQMDTLFALRGLAETATSSGRSPQRKLPADPKLPLGDRSVQRFLAGGSRTFHGSRAVSDSFKVAYVNRPLSPHLS